MDQGFPGQHTTATSVTVATTSVNATIRYDPSYIKTLPGMLKVAQVVVNALGFISMLTTVYNRESQGAFFNTVAMGGFWFTGILLSFYIFHVVEKFHKIPWLKIEFFFCVIWAALNFLASLLVALIASYLAGLAAAAFFGFSAMVLYGVDAFFKYSAYRRGDLAQGEHRPNKTVSTAFSPAY